MKFFITNHCKERYLQRFGSDIYRHLEYCEIVTCDQCKKLKNKIKIEIKNYALENEMLERLKKADETKIHHNNFNFMEIMYNKYGYDSHFRFLVSDDVVFICRDVNVVVTCINTMSSVLKSFALRPKYTKRKKA